MKPRRIIIFGPHKSGMTGLFYKAPNSLAGKLRTLFEPTEYHAHAEDDAQWVLAKTIIGVQDGPDRIKYETFMEFDRKILLVRDPRDLLISGMLFMVQQEPSLYTNDDKLLSILTLLKEKEANPNHISVYAIFKQIVELSDHHTLDQAIDWMGRQYRWLMTFEEGLDAYWRVKYEDFVDGRLADLETYLGLNLDGTAGVDPIHDHVPRTMGYNNWKNWFLKPDIDFFKPLFEDYILRYNYPNRWDLSERPSIPAEHASKYIVRTVNKKRTTPIQGS